MFGTITTYTTLNHRFGCTGHAHLIKWSDHLGKYYNSGHIVLVVNLFFSSSLIVVFGHKKSLKNWCNIERDAMMVINFTCQLMISARKQAYGRKISYQLYKCIFSRFFSLYFASPWDFGKHFFFLEWIITIYISFSSWICTNTTKDNMSSF